MNGRFCNIKPLDSSLVTHLFSLSSTPLPNIHPVPPPPPSGLVSCMATHGIPYYFEDTTGLASGPTDFLDIYDRPPFLRLSTTHPHASARHHPSRALSDMPEGRTLKIFELGARTFASSHMHRHDGSPPSAVLALDGGRGSISGSIKFRGRTGVALERWLKKSSTFGRWVASPFFSSPILLFLCLT